MNRREDQDERRSGGGTHIRPAAVAGTFYPADPAELVAAVDRHLAAGRATLAALGEPLRAPKAVIVPHAGYRNSGAVAGAAYALLAAQPPAARVVLLGPAHHVACAGLAATSADGFATPLGALSVDADATTAALACAGVEILDHAHAAEHCLEV